jgi:putative cell wall-binding protein
VLGGTLALAPAVVASLTSLGYVVTRLAGPDRAATAVAIANELGSPPGVFEATGDGFADALAAAPAAAAVHSVILFTSGTALSPETAAYRAGRPGIAYAVGGPAAQADQLATPLVGADRYATATLIASKFFPAPSLVGVASGVAFPDALVGGAYAAQTGMPLILVPQCGALPASVASYLGGTNTSGVIVFGGTAAVSDLVADEALVAAHLA